MLGRQPTLEEIGEMTGDEVDIVIEAMEVRSARRMVSTNGPSRQDLPPVWDLAAEDRGFAGVDERNLLAGLLSRLQTQEREMLELRFVNEWTQAQIAERLGCSQMHVSRMLTRALARLRAWVEIEDRGMPRQRASNVVRLGV